MEETALAVLPTTSLEEFQKSALSNSGNRLAALSVRAGKTDTVMHIGTQIRTDELVGHALTIVRVGFAALPATNPSDDSPVYETDDDGNILCDENGEPVQAISMYPICHFKEAPGYWYNGGKLMAENVRIWAEECGDDLSDYNLPNTNMELEKLGGIKCYFTWKESRKTGRKYVSMIVA